MSRESGESWNTTMSSSRKDSLFSQASMKSLDIEESNKSNSHANAAHSVHHNHDHFFPEGALACYRLFEHDTVKTLRCSSIYHLAEQLL